MRSILKHVVAFGWFITAITFNAPFAFADTSKDFSVIQLREISYQHSPAIRVRFSQPLDANELEGKIQLVEMEGQNVKDTSEEYAWILDQDKRSIIFPFVEPSTRYQVMLNDELMSSSGQELGKRYTKSIQTKYLEPAANFSSSGYLMPLTGQKSLPITVTNVDKVDVNFYYVSPEKYDTFLASGLETGTEYNYQLNRFAETAQLIYSSRFDVSPKKNQRTFVNLDVTHVTELQEPGLYVAVMSKGGKYDSNHSVINFTVSDLAVHLRQYQHKFAVQVMNLYKGKPEQDVELALYSKEGHLLNSNSTGKNGVGEITLSGDKTADYLIAKKGRNVSILPLKQSTLDLSDFNNALSPHSDIQAFSFGPRDLFRPGETAQIQVLLRDQDGQQLSNIPLSLSLSRPDGQVVQNVVLQPEVAGYYQFNYQLPKSAQTGQWKVSYHAAGQNLAQNYLFNVEDFRPNRLELEQFVGQDNTYGGNTDKLIIKSQSKLINELKGLYLFGAKAAGNKVDGVVDAKFDRHPLPEHKAYFFGDEREKLYFKNKYIRSFKLNSEGEGKVSMHNPWGNVKSPLALTYTMSLYDGGGQPTTSVQGVTLVKGQGLVGVKPGFSGEPDKNANVSFSLLALNEQLASSEDERLEVSLIREDRNYYWNYDSHRGWQFKYDAAPYQVFETSVTTDTQGMASVDVALEYGHYQLVVTNSNTSVTTTYSFKTAGRWWSNSKESKNKPDAILMSFDKSSYQPGEEAELSYFAPHSGQAWFTVENNQGVLYQDSFPVKQGENTYKFELGQSWNRHDNYASLMIVKHNETLQATKTRAFGLVHLPIKRANFKLDVTLLTPEHSLPLSQVEGKVKVTNTDVMEGDTYAVVALVDVGVLNITKYARPKPEDYFLAPRRYQVELADVYGKLIELNDGKTLAQNFGGDLVETDEELSRGGNKPDPEVEILSFLSKPVLLNQNGEADISFELPEIAGKLRWSVVVFNDKQFGSAEQFTKVSSPFVTQLSSPYFLAPNDESRSVLEVHNTTEQPLEVTLDVATSGGLVPHEVNKKLTLLPNNKELVEFAITSNGELETGLISYQIASINAKTNHRVQKQYKLPIRLAYPALTSVEHFSLEEGEQWQADFNFDDVVSGSVQGQLSLSATPPLALNNYFDSLLTYPYGCLEQTTSRALPWLFTNESLVSKYKLDQQIQRRMEKPFSQALRAEVLEKAIEGLKQKQRRDGAYSLWSEAADEYSWLTVYATDVLVEAVRSGIQVPEAMLTSSINVLKKYVRRPATIKVSNWINNSEYYRHSVRAYAAYVLAKANKVRLSDLRRIKKDMSKAKVLGSLPWAHLATSFKLVGAEKDSRTALNKAQSFDRPEGYLGDYGSDVRDLSWLYSLSLAHDLGLEIDFVELRQAVDQRRWLSTQDQARLFVLASLLDDGSERFSAEIEFINKAVKEVEDKARFNALMWQQQMSDLVEVTAEDGKVYGSVTYLSASKQAPQSKSDVIAVDKSFYDLEGHVTGLDKITSGQLLIVELTLVSNKNIRDGLVVDLLPAGLRIENQNLSESSVDMTKLEVSGEPIAQPTSLAHQEFREDRYVASLELTKGKEVRLFYLVRATAQGKYTVPATYVEDMFNPEDHGIAEQSTLIVNE